MADNATGEATEQVPADETTQENNAEVGEKAKGDDEEDVKDESEVKDKPEVKDDGQVKTIKVTFHISSATSTHLKPSLPSVLTQYGMEDTTSPRAPEKKKKDTEKKDQRKKRRSFAEDKDSDAERQKDERYLGVMDHLEKVRSDLYDEYMDLLTERVEKQRKQIRQRSQMMECKIAEQEERKRQESHKVKRRFRKKILQTDTMYLESVPKSDCYRILELQDQLVQCGRIRNQHNLDQFWQDILQPDVFYANFKVPRFPYYDNAGQSKTGVPPEKMYTKMVASARPKLPKSPKSPKMSVQEESHTSVPAQRELGSITEDADAQDSSPRDSWAITHGPTARFSMDHGTQRHKTKPKKQVALKKHMDDFDIRFPRVELPPLHCFNMDLSEKPLDPEELRRQVELKNMQIGRKIYLRKLHKMHQLAMANKAAATRIIEKRRGEFGFFPEPSLGDLLSLDTLLAPVEPKKKKQIAPVARIRLSEDSYSPEADSAADEESDFGEVQEKDRRYIPELEKPRPLSESEQFPLTLSEALGTCKIMEAKCMSTLWTNYMGVGLKAKSVES